MLGGLAPSLVERLPEPQPEPDRPAPATAQGDLRRDRRADRASGCARRSGPPCSRAMFGAVLGWDWPLVYLVPLTPLAVVLSVIDWRTKLLPTRLIVPAYLFLLPVLVALGADHPGLVGAGAGAGGRDRGAWLLLAVLAVPAQRDGLRRRPARRPDRAGARVPGLGRAAGRRLRRVPARGGDRRCARGGEGAGPQELSRSGRSCWWAPRWACCSDRGWGRSRRTESRLRGAAGA